MTKSQFHFIVKMITARVCTVGWQCYAIHVESFKCSTAAAAAVYGRRVQDDMKYEKNMWMPSRVDLVAVA
eukprot:scaffold100586_cov64-Attheya_sp.AAC.2